MPTGHRSCPSLETRWRAKPNFPARVTVAGVDKETRLGLSGVTTTGTNEEAEVIIVAAMPEEEMPLASTVD
jgi:hypothetical protein